MFFSDFQSGRILKFVPRMLGLFYHGLSEKRQKIPQLRHWPEQNIKRGKADLKTLLIQCKARKYLRNHSIIASVIFSISSSHLFSGKIQHILRLTRWFFPNWTDNIYLFQCALCGPSLGFGSDPTAPNDYRCFGEKLCCSPTAKNNGCIRFNTTAGRSV